MTEKHLDNQIQDDKMDVPQAVIDSLARRFLPAIIEYYESEEGQRAFEEWEKRKNK